MRNTLIIDSPLDRNTSRVARISLSNGIVYAVRYTPGTLVRIYCQLRRQLNDQGE